MIDQFLEEFNIMNMKTIYVSGYKKKQLSCNILNHILNYCGAKVAVASQSGIYIDGLEINKPQSSFSCVKKTILEHDYVDFAIFEIRPRHLFKNHLDYDKCSIAAITNIDTSNMGQNSLNSLERIFQSFSLLLSLSENKIVINADDPNCQKFINLKGHNKFVLVSLNNNNPLLIEHIRQGESATVIENNEIIFYENNNRNTVARFDELPNYFHMDEKRIFYTLLSISCSYALGVSPLTIKDSLKVLKTSSPVQIKFIHDFSSHIILFNRNNIRSMKYLPSFLKKITSQKECTLVCLSSYYQQVKNSHSVFNKLKEVIFTDNDINPNTKKLFAYNEFLALNTAVKQNEASDDFIVIVSEDYTYTNSNLNSLAFDQSLKYFPFKNIYQKNKNLYSILFVGDTGFGENYQEKIAKRGGENILKSKGYCYPLAKMKKSLLAADMVFANLETPLTSIKTSPFSDKKSWVHWGDVIKTPVTLKQHNIKFVNLANNHTFDYGIKGFEETLTSLEQSGINYVGAGKNSNDAMRPLLINLSSKNVSEKIAIIGAYNWSKNNEKVFNLYSTDKKGGLNPLIVEKLFKQIEMIRAINEKTFIILSLHWGKNYQWVSDAQRILAKKLLNGGADLILSHGAHMVQEFEKIGNKWSVYSLGNFMFNSPGRYKKLKAPPYSFIANLVFKEELNHFNKQLELYPIVTDNRKTQYQTRFVFESEFEELSSLLEEKNKLPLVKKSKIQEGEKKYYYLLDL